MPDYKEMYLKLFRATESAISCLIAAQQECEELYVRSSEAEIQPIIGLTTWDTSAPLEKNQLLFDDNL